MLQISKRMSLVSRKLIATCARTKSKSKSKCVCIYSGNSTTLALGNRLWGADPTSTLFCPVPWAHFCGWPGRKFSAPILYGPMGRLHYQKVGVGDRSKSRFWALARFLVFQIVYTQAHRFFTVVASFQVAINFLLDLAAFFC
jgi:hypothetical protein